MTKDPFAAFRDKTEITNEQFAKLNELVGRLRTAQQDIADAEQSLKDAKEREKQLSTHDIPDHLESLGLESFKTTDGLEIEVCTKIRASIGDRKVAAFRWLLENGHGAIIKRTVQVAFNTDQSDKAQELLQELRDRDYAGTRQELKVEAATLTSWVKERLEAGEEIPHDTFGVFEQRFTKIKEPKR